MLISHQCSILVACVTDDHSTAEVHALQAGIKVSLAKLKLQVRQRIQSLSHYVLYSKAAGPWAGLWSPVFRRHLMIGCPWLSIRLPVRASHIDSRNAAIFQGIF